MPALSERLKAVIGCCCVGVGALLLAVLVLVLPVWVQVSCRHSPGGIGSGPTHCTLQGANLLRIPWQNRRIENVVGAELNFPTYRPGWVYRTFLYTYEKEVPLASYSVSYAQAEQTRSKLQEFLALDLTVQGTGPGESLGIQPAQASSERSLSLNLTYAPPGVPLLAAALFSLLMVGAGGVLLWL